MNVNKLPREFHKQFSKDSRAAKFQNRRHEKNKSPLIGDDVDNGDIDITTRTHRSAWDTGDKFSEQYHEKHGDIVESMGDSFSLLNKDQPLLRQSNSPKPDKVAFSNSITPTSPVKSTEFQNESSSSSFNTISPSRRKTHVRKFNSRQQHDDFSFSTTSDSDDNFYTAAQQSDEYDPDEIDKLFKMELKRAANNNNNKPKHHITDVGKRMIAQSLAQYNYDKKTNETYLSSSPTSSIDQNEFPSIEESIQQATHNKKKHSNYPSNTSSQFPLQNVSSTPTPPKPRGRGQILKSLTQQPRFNSQSPGFSDINTPPRVLQPVNSVYDFPSDEELLETPHVMPAINGANISGQNVSVLKKFTK